MKGSADTVASVGVFMAVRNERAVGRVLESLGAQTLMPTIVAVVDDGSTDGTGELLESASGRSAFELEVVRLPPHRGSYVGRPELARVLNQGLKILGARSPPLDFVMKLDGDHALPPWYLQRLVERMVADPKLGVASGYIAGERFTELSPRGSGMVIRADFWREANGMRFPLEYGWESWLYLKAQASGYATRSFPDLVSRISRPTTFTKGALYGKAMYALGYFWPYALGRCSVLLPRSPWSGLEMLRGYVDHRGVNRLDVAPWVGRMQRLTLLKRGARLVAHRGLR